MGSLTRMRGGERLRKAVAQRTERIDEEIGDETEELIDTLVHQLSQKAMDSQELNNAAAVIADDPENIDGLKEHADRRVSRQFSG